MLVVTIHNLFMYSDLPLHYHPPSYWLRLFSGQTFSVKIPHNSQTYFILHTYVHVKM